MKPLTTAHTADHGAPYNEGMGDFKKLHRKMRLGEYMCRGRGGKNLMESTKGQHGAHVYPDGHGCGAGCVGQHEVVVELLGDR